MWSHKNTNKEICTFEVPNWKLTRRRATKIVSSITGANFLRKPHNFFMFRRESEFCEFTLNGKYFGIEEPFNDNSRFHIYRKDKESASEEIITLLEAFKTAW